MQAKGCGYEQLPSYGDILRELSQAELLEQTEPPLIQGEIWQRVRSRLDGCFPDIGDVPDSPSACSDIVWFGELFDPVREELVDLNLMGVLCFENCITNIRKFFPPPETPDFPKLVIAAAQRNHISQIAVLTARAIRILTIAVNLGIVTIT